MGVSATHPWRKDDDDDDYDEEDEDDPASSLYRVSCLQLTDRRVYFSWDTLSHSVPLYTGPPFPPRSTRGGVSISETRPLSTSSLVNFDDDPVVPNVDDGVLQMALIPWGPHAELGCLDLSLIPKPKYLRIPPHIRAILGESWRG